MRQENIVKYGLVQIKDTVKTWASLLVFIVSISFSNAQVFNAIVTSNNDDATEDLSTNSVNTGMNDLWMGISGAAQLVGMRVQNVTVPYGSTITAAYWTFRASTSGSSTTNLLIQGESSLNPNIYIGTNSNISSRSVTTNSVSWNNVPAWSGSSWYQSPDISTIVQELIDQDGWSSGNSMAFMISGTGLRRADSRNKGSSNCPILHIEYTPPCLTVPLLWLKADAGFSATTWLDQSPRGNDATVYGDPTQVANSLNFNPGINFDGDDHIEVSLPELVFDNGTNHLVIFCVYEPTTALTSIGVFGNQSAADLNNIHLSDGKIGLGGLSVSNSFPYGAIPHLTTLVIDEENLVGGGTNEFFYYRSGISQANHSFNETSSVNVDPIFHIGKSGSNASSLFFQGDIQEIIIYYEDDGNEAITDMERQQIESYLALKYGISLSHDYTDSQ